MSDKGQERTIFDDVCTCEYCDRRGPRHDQYGQEAYKMYEGHLLCISHYSEAKHPDHYTEEPSIQEWLE